METPKENRKLFITHKSTDKEPLCGIYQSGIYYMILKATGQRIPPKTENVVSWEYVEE